MTHADSALPVLRMPLDRLEGRTGRTFHDEPSDPDVWTDRGIGLAELHGDQDLYTLPAMRLTLDSAAHRAYRPLVAVILTEVPYMDSSAFGALVGAQKRLRGRRGLLVLSGVQAQVRSKLRICGLIKVFPVMPSLEDALHYLDKYDPDRIV